MILLALGAWWPLRGVSGPVVECDAPAKARSFISAASATAPKPLAERRRASRRESGRLVQCGHSIGAPLLHEDEFFDVDQHVAQVGPDAGIVGAAAVPERLLLQKIDGGGDFVVGWRAGERGLVERDDSLLGRRAAGRQSMIGPAFG